MDSFILMAILIFIIVVGLVMLFCLKHKRGDRHIKDKGKAKLSIFGIPLIRDKGSS